MRVAREGVEHHAIGARRRAVDGVEGAHDGRGLALAEGLAKHRCVVRCEIRCGNDGLKVKSILNEQNRQELALVRQDNGITGSARSRHASRV